MCTLNSIIVLQMLFSMIMAANIIQQAIGFPEIEEDINSVNKDNRQPVYIPAMCPVNELYYPGDQKDDWICDCRPAFLYHPTTDACWPSYRKGPCPDGFYLVLPVDSVIPVCQKNPCSIDTYVMHNGRCEKLGTMNPCRSLWPVRAVLAVNATTLNLDCESIMSLESRFAEEPQKITAVPCPPGCKRRINGKCVPVK